MNALHQIALISHIAIGAIALIIFWIPMAVRKGSPLHRRAGSLFVRGMTAVAITGVLLSSLSLIDPVGIRVSGEMLEMSEGFEAAAQIRTFSLFLLMLSVLVFATARHAVLVLQVRNNREALRTPLHVGAKVATLLLALATGVVGVNTGEVLLMIFAVIGTSGAVGMLRYTFKAELAPREWIVEHIGSAVGTGIAAYTAFFAFGGRELLAEFLPGQWQILPWVLPTVIGTLYARRASKRYQPATTTALPSQA